ncbi:MAG: low molecular weight protein-tyrosine phosphatase [Subtercola sp.]|nr:low molecular weight protein-tyrosine phosphatase [Subtercola sp.]
MTEPVPVTPAFVPFRIVMVCQGNICRSPLAEVLTRSRLGEAGLHRAVSVSSGGLGAVVGSPMDETAAEMARRYRGAPDDFRARQLRTAIVADSDLILAMTRDQRDEVVQRYPRALQRTFTLTEFSKLLATSSVDLPETSDDLASTDRRVAESLTSRSPHIARMLRDRTRDFSRIRSIARLVPGDDITDPYRQSAAVHEAVAQKISLSTSQIVHNFIGWAIDSEGIDRVRA